MVGDEAPKVAVGKNLIGVIFFPKRSGPNRVTRFPPVPDFYPRYAEPAPAGYFPFSGILKRIAEAFKFGRATDVVKSHPIIADVIIRLRNGGSHLGGALPFPPVLLQTRRGV